MTTVNIPSLPGQTKGINQVPQFCKVEHKTSRKKTTHPLSTVEKKQDPIPALSGSIWILILLYLDFVHGQ